MRRRRLDVVSGAVPATPTRLLVALAVSLAFSFPLSARPASAAAVGEVSPDGRVDAINPALPEGQACMRPEATQVSELSRAAKIEVPLPDSPVANPGKVTASVMCGDNPVLQFGDLTVRYEGGWSSMSAGDFAASLASGFGRGRVVEVAGTPAFVDESHDGLNSEVIARVGTTRVSIGSSPTASLHDLEDVLSSIVRAAS